MRLNGHQSAIEARLELSRGGFTLAFTAPNQKAALWINPNTRERRAIACFGLADWRIVPYPDELDTQWLDVEGW